jgi:hypothetical protein
LSFTSTWSFMSLLIEILVPLTTSTRACATWWLMRFHWLSCNGAKSHQHKGMQELWWFHQSSWDNPARALMISTIS